MVRPEIVDLDTWGPTSWETERYAREPARRYTARIVTAATANLAGLAVDTAVPCRRRPGHRPCGGHIVVRRIDLPEVIQWCCPRCGDRGVIQNWRRKPLDVGAPPCDACELELALPEHVYRTLEQADFSPAVARVVLGAWYDVDGVVLHGRAEALKALMVEVRRRAGSEGRRERQRHLFHVADLLRRRLARYVPAQA